MAGKSGIPAPAPSGPHLAAPVDCPMDEDLINFLSNPPGGENSFGFDEGDSACNALGSADAQPEVPDGTGGGPAEGEFDHEDGAHALRQFPETARQQVPVGGPNAASHMRCVDDSSTLNVSLRADLALAAHRRKSVIPVDPTVVQELQGHRSLDDSVPPNGTGSSSAGNT